MVPLAVRRAGSSLHHAASRILRPEDCDNTFLLRSGLLTGFLPGLLLSV